MMLPICQILFVCCFFQLFNLFALTVSSGGNDEIDLELKLAPPGKPQVSPSSSNRKETDVMPLRNTSPVSSPSQRSPELQVNAIPQTKVKTKKRKREPKPKEEVSESMCIKDGFV